MVCVNIDTELAEFNGGTNHVHLLANFPPRGAVSKLVNSLEGVSSRRMRQEFPEVGCHYRQAQRLWPGSYFAGSIGGTPLSMLRQHNEQQNGPAWNPHGHDQHPAQALVTGLEPDAVAKP